MRIKTDKKCLICNAELYFMGFSFEDNKAISSNYICDNCNTINKTYSMPIKLEPVEEITEKTTEEVIEDLTGCTLYCKYTDNNITKYGIIGEETNLTDSNGNELFVGDIVKYSYNFVRFESIIVKENGRAFLMGIESSYNENHKDKGCKVCKIVDYKNILKEENRKLFTSILNEYTIKIKNKMI